jgi:hypothetical protein
VNIKKLKAELHQTHRKLTDAEVDQLVAENSWEELLSIATATVPTPEQDDKILSRMRELAKDAGR